jgi:hypothetical protein
MDPVLVALAAQAGIHFMGVDARLQARGGVAVALDAQPELITTSNAGIPAFLSTFIDPKVIEILIAPNRAAEIVGDETKRGDWTMDTTMFNVIESTGETASYDDYSNEGKTGVNFDFPQRQSYHYQTITQWGERELDRAALARVDYANRLNIASVSTLGKYQNKTYFYGVEGLKLYGLLNDPTLFAAIAPVPDATESNAVPWADKSAFGIYNDILALFTQLQSQTDNAGLVDMEDKMTLAISPAVAPNLGKLTTFNVNVRTMLKDNFPNMTIKTAPEYSTEAGNLVQLIVDEVEGQRTASCAFTEKLRAHPVKVELSSFQQKKSQGSWGTVIFRPVFIAQMLGV